MRLDIVNGVTWQCAKCRADPLRETADEGLECSRNVGFKVVRKEEVSRCLSDISADNASVSAVVPGQGGVALGRSVVRKFVPCSGESGDTCEVLEAQVGEIRSFESRTVVGFREDKEALDSL